MLKPIAYVQASWHSDTTDHCREAFMAELGRHGYTAGDVAFFSVPGSLEIPLMARRLPGPGATRRCAPAAWSSTAGSTGTTSWPRRLLQGIVQTSLETDVPMVSAVLTPHHFHEHDVHEEFFKRHMATKGKELAEA